MSDVYLARDPSIGRLVVLKIVEQCATAWSEAIAEAERRGAAIQQQLHALDPRVLEIYDVGEQNGSFYVAMQYAEGRSVAELLAQDGRLPAPQAARIAAEICSQLVSLHSFETEIDGRKRAVVHGDIKPSNIQIGPDDDVRLLDFGIAKAISATRKLTHHDLGSPAYCSPERLNSSQVDAQADLWAVGVCLYEMVAGLPPYQAQTTRKLENVIQSRRPPRALPADCPRALRGIIQKGLAADPSLRYASARDFENDLRSFLLQKPAAADNDSGRGWQANATVEKPRLTAPARVRSFSVPARAFVAALRSARGSLLAGILSGIFVFVPAVHITRAWTDSAPLRHGRDYLRAGDRALDEDMRLLAQFEGDYAWLRRLSPARPLRKTLVARLVAAADVQFAAYRTQAASPLSAFEWSGVRACLERALLLSPSDSSIRGRLALAEANEELLNRAAPPTELHQRLTGAVSLLPSWPDPHLALAAFYVYHQQNLGLATAEWHTAEKLGFATGPREWEQEADAWLARVESTFGQFRAATAKDEQRRLYSLLTRNIARARQRYEPIAGFGNADRSLARVEQLERAAAGLDKQRAQATPSARRYRKNRSWR
jgi:tRNA A-37 threonylcarbamoyl transferase component Bud32